METNEDKVSLPHHEQLSLCTTRLPYRQGRKLTAVKVYSIAKESNHLLIFGVPSLNLRQEAKALFSKFGGLTQFHISKDHAAEPFTETYHAQFDKIHPARLAKRFLDTKNFYGGILHVCYAPELENIDETRQKLIQRRKDVVYRLKNLQKQPVIEQKVPITENIIINEPKTLNMGEINTISVGKPEFDVSDYKNVITRRYKPYVSKNKKVSKDKDKDLTLSKDIEIIDYTNTETEVLSNINEALNYDKFGSEVVRKIPKKPLNTIQFHVNKKS